MSGVDGLLVFRVCCCSWAGTTRATRGAKRVVRKLTHKIKKVLCVRFVTNKIVRNLVDGQLSGCVHVSEGEIRFWNCSSA